MNRPPEGVVQMEDTVKEGRCSTGGINASESFSLTPALEAMRNKREGPRGFDGFRDDGDDEAVKTSVWIDGTRTEKARGQSLAPFHTLDKQLYEGTVSIAACRTNPSIRRQSFDHARLASPQRGIEIQLASAG